MSDSNTASLAFQRETSLGVLATPALKLLRFTKEALEHEKMTVESAIIRSDRQIDETVQVGVQAKGSVDFELTVGDFDQFLESALFSAFADVSGTPTLINGVTRTSYLFEKKLAASSFVSFAGMVLDQMTLNFASRQIVTGQMQFLGLGGTGGSATVDANAAYTAAGTGVILSASTNVANITVGGAALASVKSLSLTVNNNLRANDVIGQNTLDDIGVGSIKVTGKLDAYFRNMTLLNAFMNHSEVAISLEAEREHAGAASGDPIGYRFTIPRVTFPKGMPNIPGKDTDIMLPIEFAAMASTDGTHTIKIEKIEKA